MKSECSDIIVRAHTVPKKESLLKIARDNHVYSPALDLESRTMLAGKIQPHLVGINEASTFTGFCSKHDNDIFIPIERKPFAMSKEQCFLLAYRATVMETFKKNLALSASKIRKNLDRGKSLNEQRIIQFENSIIDYGVSLGIKDFKYNKGLYDKILLTKDYSDIRACIFVLEQPPPVMCSSVYSIQHDFNGNKLQNINNPNIIAHQISYTSFYSGSNGFIVFSWLSRSDVICKPLIKSLIELNPKKITDSLIALFFTFTENVHIQPDWWETLPNIKRKLLVNWLSEVMEPSLPKSLKYLDNGVTIDNWPIIDTQLIGYS